MEIRNLVQELDFETVTAFYREAPDYWMLAEGIVPGPDKALEFFTECAPGSDIADATKLGVFLDGRLSGLADLSVGFPEPGDAYLGLMMLGPWARGQGIGAALLRYIEGLVASPQLYLAVLDANPRGRAFWEKQGFRDTGKTGSYEIEGMTHVVRRMVKTLDSGAE